MSITICFELKKNIFLILCLKNKLGFNNEIKFEPNQIHLLT